MFLCQPHCLSFDPYFQPRYLVRLINYDFSLWCHGYNFLQSSGAVSAYSKSMRLFDKNGILRICRADFDTEICSIFMKNQTNCSTIVLHSIQWLISVESLFQEQIGRTAAEVYGIRLLKAGSSAQPNGCSACFVLVLVEIVMWAVPENRRTMSQFFKHSGWARARRDWVVGGRICRPWCFDKRKVS